MDIVVKQERTPECIAALVEIWEGAVRATHHFLSQEAIARIKAYVPQAIAQVPVLLLAQEQEPLAFMGLDGERLEMLFVSARARGTGIGTQMMEYGMRHYGLRELTVNEQNPQAVGFYARFGFRVYQRTALDEAGEPYPLLYMRREGGM